MKLAEYLEVTGVTPDRLARDAKVTAQTVRNLLAGRWVSLRTAWRIQEATHGAVRLQDMVAAAEATTADGSRGVA
jgi:hypothetical protein